MNVLVTGANGLVGTALCVALEQSGYLVMRAVRQSQAPSEHSIGDIHGQTNWGQVFTKSIDAVVHLAAHVHVMHDDPQSAHQYREVNTEGTLNLARQCAGRGVKRFVFVSTVKVLGEGKDRPYGTDDPALPVGPYAISKWEAEQGLLEIAARTGMEVVILRPPLVYGPGVGANFLRLMKAVEKGLPLPFGLIRNQRSLVYLSNLVDAIRICISHPAAGGKTYLVSDGEDVSSPELVRRLASALGRKAFLLPLPCSWMRLVARLFGKDAAIERLLGSLAVDSMPIREELSWSPPYSMQAGLKATAAWYHKVKTV